ncbi:PREDICTED: uncharacterized protein LOC101300799 isoform 1 [Fragaria vesca subsp. vesca]
MEVQVLISNLCLLARPWLQTAVEAGDRADHYTGASMHINIGPLQYKHISTVSLSFIRTLLASSSLLNFSLFSMVQLCNKFSLSRPRLDLAQGSRSWCSVELQGLDGIISGATIPLYKASRTCL